MTLTTHAVVGATLATLTPNPVLGFIIGFGSHYFLDAIPHWSYAVESIKKDEKNSLNTSMTISKDSYNDLLKIGIDGIFGLLLSFVLVGMFHSHSFLVILMGALGGMTPDALQFCYWNWKHEPLITFQRLHNWAHTSKRIDDKPVIGILSQVLIILLVVIIF
jgi:hypothetical protein